MISNFFMLKLISWNITGRLSKVNQQIDYLNSGEFDIICPQEVISKTHILNTVKLREYNAISAVELGSLQKIGKHKYNLLILSKAELLNNRPSHYIKWSEKNLSGILKFFK
jgi:exonuclease III